MLLDLSEIVTREGMRVNVEVDQPGVEDPDLVFAEPLRGRLTFSNSGDLINIQGKVQTTLTIACSRCLADVRVPVRVPVEEHFPIDDVLHPERLPEEGEEFDTVVNTVVYVDQGRPILDLDELLRQLLVTEIPIRTLCSDACLGLCPQCGANRNEAPCACAEREENRPLAGLAALLEDEPNGSVER
jgi:DUF177 domain-containing protein